MPRVKFERIETPWLTKCVDSIKRFLGTDKDGRGVSPSTSLLYSMVLSLLISIGLRWIFPTMPPLLRFALFFGVVFLVFRWIDKNHRSKRQ